MKIAVSACLLGVPCRFDGTAKPSEAVRAYLERTGAEVVRVCPEVMGGLSIPHPPHEIARAADGAPRVVDEAGADHTAAFEAGAQAACRVALRRGCTHAILKAKSPSCGVGQVYDGTFSAVLVPGDGLAAVALREAGLELATEKDFENGADPFSAA